MVIIPNNTRAALNNQKAQAYPADLAQPGAHGIYLQLFQGYSSSFIQSSPRKQPDFRILPVTEASSVLRLMAQCCIQYSPSTVVWNLTRTAKAITAMPARTIFPLVIM